MIGKFQNGVTHCNHEIARWHPRNSFALKFLYTILHYRASILDQKNNVFHKELQSDADKASTAKVSAAENYQYHLTTCYILQIIPGGPKKRPEFSHGVMQQSGWNESAEKHVYNEQTSSNMSRTNFHLKRFHIGRDTSEIVLRVIKQCLQAVRHLSCWLYAGYTRTSQ